MESHVVEKKKLCIDLDLDAYQGQIKQERENRLAMQQELDLLKGMLLITLDSCQALNDKGTVLFIVSR